MSLSSSERYIAISLLSKLVLVDSKTGKVVWENIVNTAVTGSDPPPAPCSAISRTSKYVAGTFQKTLSIWRTDDGSLLRQWELRRTPSSIAFSPSEDVIVAADKSGEVCTYGVEHDKPAGEFVLGHISMLLDVLISKDGRFIISCDRDDKIRVSRFPNAYNIHGFCLGHKECVTSLDFLAHDSNILLSTSIDGTLRLWDYCACMAIACAVSSEKSALTLVRSTKIDPCTSSVCHLSADGDVSVYLASSCDNGGLTIDLKHKYQPGGIPRSMALTCDALWILQTSRDSPTECYDSSKLLEKLEIRLSDLALPINECLTRSKELLDKTFEIENQVDILYKRQFDEIQAYMSTKLKRIKNSDGST